MEERHVVCAVLLTCAERCTFSIGYGLSLAARTHSWGWCLPRPPRLRECLCSERYQHKKHTEKRTCTLACTAGASAQTQPASEDHGPWSLDQRKQYHSCWQKRTPERQTGGVEGVGLWSGHAYIERTSTELLGGITVGRILSPFSCTESFCGAPSRAGHPVDLTDSLESQAALGACYLASAHTRLSR